MKNEILEFLNRHNGGKTAEIAEALAVTDYQARYYLLLLEKEGVVQRSPLRRGMATYWLLKGEKPGGAELFFHNLITQPVGMLH